MSSMFLVILPTLNVFAAPVMNNPGFNDKQAFCINTALLIVYFHKILLSITKVGLFMNFRKQKCKQLVR